MISKVWNFLFKSHIMTWKYNISIFMASDFLEGFIFDSDSVWVSSRFSSCAMTTQLYHMFMTAFATTKTMNTTVQTCPTTWSIASVSNSSFWMPSRTLLAIIIERHMKTQNLKWLTTSKQVGQASAFTRNTMQSLQYFQDLPSKTFQFQIVPSGIAPF